MRTNSKIIAAASALAAAAGGDAHAWRLDYTLEAGILHSDNINLSPVDPVREDVLVPRIDLGLTHAGARVNVDIGAALEHRTYLDDTYGSEFRGTFDGRVNWLLLPERLTWTFADNLGLYPVSLRAPDVPGNLQQTNVFSTGPTLRFRFNPSLQGQAEARWSDAHAEQTGAFDSTRVSGAFRLLHDFSTTRHLSGNLEVEDVDFDDDLLGDDYRRYSAYAGYTQSLARIDVDAALGYSRLEFDRGGDASGPLLRTSLDWRATDRSTFGFGATWRYSDAATSLAEGGAAFDTGLEGVGVGGALITPDVFRERRFDASYLYQGVRLNLASTAYAARFRYERDELVDADRNEVGLGLTLGYLLRPLMTLGLAGEATRRSFIDTASTDRDYRYGVYFAHQFARRWSWRADLSRYERHGGDGVDSFDENALYLRLIYTH